MRYAELVKKPSLFQTFTGLSIAAFQELLPAFQEAYEDDLAYRDSQKEKPRQRQRGGGRPSQIPEIEDKLVFILVYFRFYPVQVLQGFLFGLSQPQASDWIHRLTPILNMALGYEQQLPARQAKDIETILAACPELEFMIDGTERPVRRPKDPEQQKHKYSGKKKRHTVKNNIITEKKTGKIKGLSPTVSGKIHDKKLADEQDLSFPENSKLWQDTGFQGYAPEHVTIIQPKKKPRGGELSLEDKAQNAAISRERISVEHSIGGLKVFRIVHHIFRNLKPNFDDLVMETACGLHNLRLDFPMMK
ncbi:transposase [Candidatus Bathyarchaeota archaeon]|nr:transposase [Candidatus Bathyarchaeota archaeon]